jgi:phosphotriesterase-related protein
MKMKRRDFISRASMAGIAFGLPNYQDTLSRAENFWPILTVKGEIKPEEMGFTLTHEHLIVDFIGAAKYDPGRWNDEEVIRRVTPYLEEIKSMGCRTFIDCTPEYIGRDPGLLRQLSESTGINILTNTGLYGAADNKYLPDYAYRESADKLSGRWIREFEEGIGNSKIRPGFMKIGVAGGPLSGLHRKLVEAAAMTHLKTGMTIASHTGPAVAAFDELNVLKESGVHPEAFIWVHAQNEEDEEKRFFAAEMGAWVSLDGLGTENTEQYIGWLQNFKKNQLLEQVLISHDAGWYSPGEPDGGDFRDFTPVFTRLIPGLKATGFTPEEINTLFVRNPGNAFGIRVRNL